MRIVSPDKEGRATIPYALQPASKLHTRWDRLAVIDADRSPNDHFGFADMLLHFANATDSMTTATWAVLWHSSRRSFYPISWHLKP